MLEVEHLTGIPIADLEAEIGAGRLRGVVDDQGLRRIHLDELDTFVARNRGVVVEVFFDLPSWKSEEEPGPIGDPLAVRSDKGVMRLVQYWDELTEDLARGSPIRCTDANCVSRFRDLSWRRLLRFSN